MEITGKLSINVPQTLLASAGSDQTLQRVLIKAFVQAELELNGFHPKEVFVGPEPELLDGDSARFRVVFHE